MHSWENEVITGGGAGVVDCYAVDHAVMHVSLLQDTYKAVRLGESKNFKINNNCSCIYLLLCGSAKEWNEQ